MSPDHLTKKGPRVVVSHTSPLEQLLFLVVMSSQDIIFILQSPMICSGDSAQFHRTLEVSTAPLVTPRTHILTGKTIHQTSLSRLKRFNISSHTAQSPKARLSLTADSEPLLVSRQDDQRPEASHKRTLLQAFSLKDLSLDSPSPQRARAEITDVAQSFKRTGCGRSHLYADRSSSSTRVRSLNPCPHVWVIFISFYRCAG